MTPTLREVCNEESEKCRRVYRARLYDSPHHGDECSWPESYDSRGAAFMQPDLECDQDWVAEHLMNAELSYIAVDQSSEKGAREG